MEMRQQQQSLYIARTQRFTLRRQADAIELPAGMALVTASCEQSETLAAFLPVYLE